MLVRVQESKRDTHKVVSALISGVMTWYPEQDKSTCSQTQEMFLQPFIFRRVGHWPRMNSRVVHRALCVLEVT